MPSWCLTSARRPGWNVTAGHSSGSGGVPARIIIDNARCAITRACFHDPVAQRAYAEYAEGYRFRIDACPPRDPKKKGRVEAGIQYLKRGFVPTREFRSPRRR